MRMGKAGRQAQRRRAAYLEVPNEAVKKSPDVQPAQRRLARARHRGTRRRFGTGARRLSSRSGWRGAVTLAACVHEGRKRDGQPHRSRAASSTASADTAAAEPGRLDHASCAGRVAIGRRDQTVNGSQGSKALSHGKPAGRTGSTATRAWFRCRRRAFTRGFFAAVPGRRAGGRQIDPDLSPNGCPACAGARHTFVTVVTVPSRFGMSFHYDAFTGTRFEPRAFHRLVLADESALSIHRRFFCLNIIKKAAWLRPRKITDEESGA